MPIENYNELGGLDTGGGAWSCLNLRYLALLTPMGGLPFLGRKLRRRCKGGGGWKRKEGRWEVGGTLWLVCKIKTINKKLKKQTNK